MPETAASLGRGPAEARGAARCGRPEPFRKIAAKLFIFQAVLLTEQGAFPRIFITMKRIFSGLLLAGGLAGVAVVARAERRTRRRDCGRADPAGRGSTGPEPGADAGARHAGGRQHRRARPRARTEPAAARPVFPPVFRAAAKCPSANARNRGDRFGHHRGCRPRICSDQRSCRRERDEDRGHHQRQPALHGKADRPRPRDRHRRVADFAR